MIGEGLEALAVQDNVREQQPVDKVGLGFHELSVVKTVVGKDRTPALTPALAGGASWVSWLIGNGA